jgi:hypothetical protein
MNFIACWHLVKICDHIKKESVMKKIVWLSVFLCSSILQASEQKRIKTEHHVTMYQGFVDLLQTTSGQKSLDDLEHKVWQKVSLHQLQKALQDRSHQGRFEDKKMHPSVAQLCAIMRIKLLVWEAGLVSEQKRPGIFESYIKNRLQLDE